MKTFRKIMQSRLGRFVTSGLILTTLHVSADPSTYLSVVEQHRQREEQIRAIAAKMNVDPEFLLNPQGRTKFDWRKLFSFSDEAVVTNDQPLEIREAVKRVKDRYALVAADTVLSRIAQLSQISLEGKNKGQVRAELQSVLRLIDKDFLPAVKDEAPGVAKSRDNDMRRELKDLRQRVKSVINAPHALDEANLESTLTNLRAAINGTITVRHSKPRWTRDPFPVKDTYRFANIKPAGPSYDENGTGSNATTPAIVSQSTETPSTARLRPVSTATSAEVTSLASSLGTPAKIFAWVHDNIDWDSYSGVAKGSLGTLQERRGNDWDQAILLRDLLAARGYDARIEWGKVTLPIAKAMNLVGTEDPLQAANLLATAGFDGLVLTAKNQPVAVQMTHAWVRAFIPYVPNRGATAGTPDTWVRMDPSFKRYEYQTGIAINGKVNWSEDEYLQTSAIRPPAEFYGDKIWNYIRTSNIDCVNLSQVTKAGRITATNYPFVPATLTTKIESVAGVAQTPPVELMQSVTMTVTDINGAVMSSYTTSLADVWGKKLSITFPPATADDAATIAAYGGLFNTPAYLIKLKPVFSIDDVPVADGSPVAAGAVLDLNTTFRQPNVADDFTHHELVAGETHAVVLDPGMFPDSLLESRINRLKTLTNEEAQLSEKLYLVGLRYMQHVDDGINFAAGVRWQRPVKRVFEADVRRQIDITYNVAGAAVRLTPAENNIDVSRLLVGIVPINNDLTNRASALALAGLQSSYLEAAIWEEMESQQGISAAKALLLARMSGQQLYTVNASNVNTVLNTVNLSSEVENEIRSAVGQGRIAKIASANITLGGWTGTGYILQDPQTGAATYPISGGLAGGSMTAAAAALIAQVFGSEPWLESAPWAFLLREWLIAAAEMYPTGLSSTVSDPVNITTGNMYRTFSDLAIIARGIPVGLTRTYNSQSSRIGEFGYGWTFNYGARLEPAAAGGMTYVESDGTEHLYLENPDGTFTTPAGKDMDLSREGGGYSLGTLDGMGLRFDSNGRLTAMRDPNGNVLTISRDAAGMPATVVDASGRTVLTFTTAGGRITKITDVAGRTTQYIYNGDDLMSVTSSTGRSWTYAYDLEHNLTEMVAPGGITNSFDYDADDRMFHHVDANGAEEFFHYDIAGRSAVYADKRQGESLIRFDDGGRATYAADPTGNVYTAEWDAENRRSSMTDSRGNVVRFEYDANGNLVKEIRPEGTMSRTYDAAGHKLSETNERGVTTAYTYDSKGNTVEVATTVGGRVEKQTFEYDAYGRKIASTDPNGNTSHLEWNDNGSIAAIVDAAGRRSTMQSDVLGQVSTVTGPTGLMTKLEYDPRGQLTKFTDPYGVAISLTYDAAGRKSTLTTPQGVTRYTYDANGRLLSTTDPLGNTTTATYDPAGALLSVRDPRGNVSRYVYDSAGRMIKSIGADGAEWQYAYCAALRSGAGGCSTCGGGGGGGEQFCDIYNPAGGRIHREFDAAGRVISVTDNLGHSYLTQYDSAGNVTMETNALGQSIRYTYDELGRLLTITDPLGGVTSFAYDLAGNRIKKTNARGQSWTYKYDALHRLTEEADPLGRKTTFTYDTLGNVATRTDGKSQTTQFTYDGTKLTAITYPDGSKDEYGYDALGRQTSIRNGSVSLAVTYDGLNRIKTLTNQTYNIGVQYEYDAAGNRTKMITPRSTATYVYDSENRLTSFTDTLFGTFRFAYDIVGRRTSLQYPNGTVTAYQYDEGSRLSSVGTTGPTGLFDLWAYTYDAIGNRLSRTNVSNGTDIFRYDAANRLTAATYASGAFEQFTYDGVGNRLSSVTQSGTTNYSYDVANQLLSSGSTTFTYDANGNVVTKTAPNGTTTFTYDTNNRITKIVAPEGTETNKYGADGRRVDLAGTPIENGQVRILTDLEGNPIMDWGTDNQTWTYRLYAPGVDELLAEWRRTNNRTTYMHHDALGSVTAVSDVSGKLLYRQDYSAFGVTTKTSDGTGIPPTRIGYTGREQSVGAMQFYRARHYSPDTGRFMQPDPIQSTMGSLYAYAENNPVLYTDPTGLYCINPSSTGKQINDWVGFNLTKGDANAKPPIPQEISLTHPGFCWYRGDHALNFYLDTEGPTKYNLKNWGMGYLWPFHYNFKKIPWVVGSGAFNKGGYTFSASQERFNIHMGYWTNDKVICYIIDDNKWQNPSPQSEYTGINLAFCADWRILGITAAIIVAIVLVYFFLGAVGALGAGGAGAAGAGGLAPVIRFAPQIIETTEEFARRLAA